MIFSGLINQFKKIKSAIVLIFKLINKKILI